MKIGQSRGVDAVRFGGRETGVVGALFVALFLAAVPVGVKGQNPESVIRLDPIIVNAERIRTPLTESVAAVSVLSREDLARVPSATMADALRQLPGFALVDQDGLGRDPQLISRGFYGGGEAEYMVVLLDGRPLNDVQSGLVRWDAIPFSAVERVEVLHGGASALWGDAAIGGVLNIVTRAGATPFFGWDVAGGSNSSWRGSASGSGELDGHAWSLFGGMDRTEGFREHSERTTGRMGGEITLSSGPTGTLRASAVADWRHFDEPGALSASETSADPAGSSPSHRFDGSHDQGLRADLTWDRPIGTHTTFTAGLFGERRETEATRTLILVPVFFADTKERVLDSSRAGGSAQLAIGGDPYEIGGRLLVGVDFSVGTLDSRYYQVAMGSEADYLTANGSRGDLDASGEGDRRMISAYAHYQLLPTERLRFSVGVRGDRIDDSFRPAGATEIKSDHSAISPRVGANVEYLQSETQSGNFYLSVGRSFKAPTLDQLFDQRSIPVAPGFSISTSNPLLVPQKARSYEAGIYHRVAVGQRGSSATLTLSAYRMDMTDELDFNVEELKYVNIGESRHEGIEAGLQLRDAVRGSSAFLNYTLQDATYLHGAFDGNRLKAIPRHSLSVGASTALFAGLEAGAVVSRQSAIYLDDSNTVELPDYTRVDARLSYPVAGFALTLDVRNLFDAEYSTTGFIFYDQTGGATQYLRPAAGRSIEIGVRGVR